MPGRSMRILFLGLLAGLLIALALPGVAAAAEFTVDSVVDERDEDLSDGICKATVFDGTCTLRAAIEEVNEQGDPESTIKFDPTVFDGEESGVIFVAALLGALPAIEVPTKIEAGSNCTADGVEGAPCAGLIGLPGEPVLAVKANDSKISGLAITSGSVLIGVYEESTGFEATGNWLGVGLNGSNALPASAVGILLEPGSDEATIGGSLEADRNVIAFNDVGLDVNGASKTTVRGDFFGVKGDGKTPGPQEVDVKITDSTAGGGFKAEDNEIGAVLGESAQKSAACDGGCNVISAAREGVVLYGANPLDVPATGPTTIHGNYIGLDSAGDEAVKVEGPGGFEGNQSIGISAGVADGVTIGGDPESEANYIVGGSNGVSTEDSDGFEARGNAFGYAPNGADAAVPTTSAVFAFMAGTGSAVIADNRIRMEAGGTGIKHFRNGGTITGNTIKGGEVGINSTETGTPAGSLIEDNVIEDTEDNGIFLGNPGNKVFGNEIFRAGGSGIELEAATDAVKGNVIGGDSSLAENAIFDSDGWAVLIHGTEGSRNEIRRNHGSGNEGEGPFIVFRTVDVVPNEKDPNGIKRPTISAAGKTEASGKGVPGALVRVFFKASEEDGELGGFLGEGVADLNGNWQVTYAAVPSETLVTATQTKGGGTSELAETAKTPPDPPPPSCATNVALCPPITSPVVPSPPVVSPTPQPKPLKCKKGFVKKKVKGKPKCVKVKKHKGKSGKGKRPTA